MSTMATYHYVTVLQALVRDGFRCHVSGIYDYESIQTWPAVEAMANEIQVGYTQTECCHIFSDTHECGQRRKSGTWLSFISRAQH